MVPGNETDVEITHRKRGAEMKLVQPYGDDEDYLDTEIIPHDERDAIHIFYTDGFAGIEGLQIQDYILTWEQVEQLKFAISKAEELWK